MSPAPRTNRPLLLASVLLARLLAGAEGAARADAVLEWNGHLLDALRAERVFPTDATRALAIVNVAMFDAVNGIVGGYLPYRVTGEAPAGASPDAAAAAAAHATLAALYPRRVHLLDAAFAATLASLAPDADAEHEAVPRPRPDTRSATAIFRGIDWGQTVARQILALRAADGSNPWIPPQPPNAPPARPYWRDVAPWAIGDVHNFRLPAPPGLESDEYAAAFDEVRRLGAFDSAERTAEQSQIARFWDDGVGSATPPGHWQEIAVAIARQRGGTLHENARLLTLLALAAADAAIVAWDNKYYFNHWRPMAAIRSAATDRNPVTVHAETWTPLLRTPPFPAYASGHSTFSFAAARVLELYYGRDQVRCETYSALLPGVSRHFQRFSDAAAEAGQSRIYGGIHWQYDNTMGRTSGRAVAEHVWRHVLLPLSERSPPVATRASHPARQP